MRIAVLADVHGDPVALDATLARLESEGGVDLFLVLGDLAAIGADPAGVIERIRDLEPLVVIRGNTDRHVYTGTLPRPTPDEVRSDPDLLPRLVEVVTTFAWTRGAITAAGQFDWISGLPLEHRMTLPDGTRLLAVHASPGRDDGPGVPPSAAGDVVAGLCREAGADVILVGHTHRAFHLQAGGCEIVNPGSVGNPGMPDRMAGCALIDCDQDGHRITLLRVPYDHEAAIAAVRRAHHPAGDYIASKHGGGARGGSAVVSPHQQ